MNKILDLLTELEARNVHAAEDGKYNVYVTPERMNELPINFHEKPSNIVSTTKFLISEHETFRIVAIVIEEGVSA